MHLRLISHGDLKPENLVFETRYTPGNIPLTRLIDFGFAVDRNDTLFKKFGINSTQFGTPLYMAPEKLLNMPLTEKSDIWAIGVMVYYLLSGYPPFNGSSEDEVYGKIKECDYEFYEEFNFLSKEAKDFIERCLDPVLDNRLSAAQALDHPWLQKFVIKPTHNEDLLQSLLKYSRLSDF